MGKAVYSGANAHFLEVNKNSLLKDTKIQLIVYDDKYEPELTIENTKKLIKEDIFAFFGFVGTPTVKKILPILESHDIPFIAPFTGAPFLRKTNEKNYVNFRSSYQEEISHIVKYLHKKKKITKFAVFYQNDDYGEVGFVSLLHALDNEGLTLAGEGAYKRNTLSIRHAFYEIKSVKPQAVLMVGAYKANALFIKTAKSNPVFKDTIFCNLSFGDADEMIKELNYETNNLLFSQVVPYFNDDSKAVILEYKKMMNKYYPKQELGFVSLEAFLAAKTLTMALNNIKGRVSRDKFLKEIKNLPKNSLDGIMIDFKNSELHNEVYLFEYKNSKFIEVKQ
ncbi:ABC transporter substrate-binding protein [Sulfurimonas sp.]|uniref:ABC transporter substrate-binding protein n=1 Tax=Sulfurimonas sp. TaxID=2022749 RepID=UPI002AB1729C|nr:ABC transporter substrate-binding protein [Sulfurimonas sp.]